MSAWQPFSAVPTEMGGLEVGLLWPRAAAPRPPAWRAGAARRPKHREVGGGLGASAGRAVLPVVAPAWSTRSTARRAPAHPPASLELDVGPAFPPASGGRVWWVETLLTPGGTASARGLGVGTDSARSTRPRWRISARHRRAGWGHGGVGGRGTAVVAGVRSVWTWRAWHRRSRSPSGTSAWQRSEGDFHYCIPFIPHPSIRLQTTAVRLLSTPDRGPVTGFLEEGLEVGRGNIAARGTAPALYT